MNGSCDFIETVKSKGTLRTVKHVISKRKFEDEDIIIVQILSADTQNQDDTGIAHLVVEDEHPDARGKKGCPVNVFILGDFPHKDIPFHEGEIIALRGGCISENDKGTLELVFTNDEQNTILREEFHKYNKEDVFSKTTKFLVAARNVPNDILQLIKEMKRWVGCGLVAAVPKELTLGKASLKTVSRYNLVCKVVDIREIDPWLGLISVADGSICRRPFLTINDDRKVEFVSLDECNFSVDVIVTLSTEALKDLQKGSYVKLFGIQGKIFPLPLSRHDDCIVFKIDGRNFSFEPVVSSERERISNLLRKRYIHYTTAGVSYNLADYSAKQLSIASSSNKSVAILESDSQHNANPSDDEGEDNSQSILRHRMPPSGQLRGSGTQSKFPGEIQQHHNKSNKQHQFYGEEKRGPNRKEVTRVESDDGDVGSRYEEEVRTSVRPAPSNRHKPEHLNVGGTCCGTSDRVNKSVNESCAVPTRGHCARNSSSKERAQCRPSALNQSQESARPESNYGRTEQDPDTDEESTDDELLVVEKQIGLRRLKYLPGIYHVNVWIKDVLPSLFGSPLDLITARCPICRKEQSYTRISKQQPHSEQQICLPCSSQGMPKFLELRFKFTLVLWDACEREISASVTGEEAEKFLKCSVYTYIRDELIRQQVWNTLRKLRERGCYRKFRRAQDLIEVDIGVTVEKGIKKYMLLGGELNNT